MGLTRRGFLGTTAAFTGLGLFGDGRPQPPPAENPYEKPDGRASNAVFVRRAYLDLAGRLPTVAEAQGYVQSKDPERKVHLVDDLLARDSFADYWSMKFCDILRVKSEFPVNLWPNAVYVYHRRIRNFVKNNERWEDFAKALLLATGSDFRDAEANFYRATARRTPEGLAEVAALTFLGWHWNGLSEERKAELAGYFKGVRIKNTREWKEEIVEIEGEDRRGEFWARLMDEWKGDFNQAFRLRLRHWLFGPKYLGALPQASELRVKDAVRELVLSPAYERGPVTGGFPCRRLDAEVLDDALCDLTGLKRNYQSIAPEPFTFLPPDRRSILIEDGSISNAFLLLFGRPARDSGLLSERDNEVTAKQRLYLFNSGKIFQSLGRLTDTKAFRRLPFPQMIADLYWRFYSRPPTGVEKKALLDWQAKLPKNTNEKWRFPRDLAWSLLNSREFLYQH